MQRYADRRRRSRGLLGALLMILAVSGAAGVSAAAEKTLYQRLGGYDAVAAVVDDFLGRMIADDKLGRFFAGLGDDRKMRARQLTVDFVCNVTGGPCLYLGRDMKTAHVGMGITKADWDASTAHLAATLDKFQVPEAEKGEMMALVGSLEGGIVDKMP